MVVAGIDVGGPDKGFHAAALDDGRRILDLYACREPDAVARWARDTGCRLVAVDSPIGPAPPGRTSREGERALARSVCGIRWTPDRDRLEARPDYYGWVLNGFRLYEALRALDLPAIECFPTASWTRLAGRRGNRTRAAWTRDAVSRLGIGAVPSRTSQDVRDAIAAALTALSAERDRTERFGELVVPVGG